MGFTLVFIRRACPATGRFLSSLAVYDTIEELTGEKPVLKWPNDVLMHGKKLCGTLP